MMFNVHLQSTDINFSLMEKAQINMYCYDSWAKLDNYNYYLFHCVLTVILQFTQFLLCSVYSYVYNNHYKSAYQRLLRS